jgi:hypothetical protein
MSEKSNDPNVSEIFEGIEQKIRINWTRIFL